jgi:hypothetical protein
MIGYHITTSGIYCSDGSVRKESPYLEWILEHHAGEPRILYDLDGSVAALLKLIALDREDGCKLASNKELQLDSYRIKYFPESFFSIDKGEHGGHLYANFMNAAAYAEPHYVGAGGPDESLQKAKDAKAVGDQIVAVYKELGLDTNNIASPIGAFLKRYNLNIPRASDIPDEAAKVINLAYASVKGNWLEAWQRGYWPEAFDYDISGAYPSELVKLLDIRRGEWITAEDPPEAAVYGFAHGSLTTNKDFHPFLYRDKNNRNINLTLTPVGTRPDALPLDKIRLIKEYPDLGKWDPDLGWWWIPKGPQFELFKGPVNFLWNKRPEAAGVGREVVKKTLSGIWGKMLETHISDSGKMKLGDHFQPIYGSVVENAIQVKDARVCIENNVIPLQIAVDGIITDKKLKLDEGPGLGQWRLSHKGQCIIVSAGAVAFEGKPGAEEFSLTFDWLYDAIKKNPRKREYLMTKWSPLTLARAINGDWLRLGEIGEVSRSILIKEDSKRMWMDTPKNGGDLLKRKFTSAPWECSMLNIGG